jgi:hypothetical protein
MGVDLIVMRPSGSQIALLEWMQIVDLDPDLRMRGQSYEAVNPRTGEKIRMRAGAKLMRNFVSVIIGARSCVTAMAN